MLSKNSTLPTPASPAPGELPAPRIVAIKRWDWAGCYARWEWRYLIGNGRQPWTIARVIRHYSGRVGHSRVHRLLEAAQQAYQEPDGIPAGILMGRSVLVPSAAPAMPVSEMTGGSP